MNYILIIIISFIIFSLFDFIATKIVSYLLKRKAKNLYKSFDCQVNDLDINILRKENNNAH